MNSYSYSIPNNSRYMYRNTGYSQNSQGAYPYNSNDERFFFAPFLVGGLAGTALGYGIANNNQINRPPCCGGGGYMYPAPMPVPYYPAYNTTNYYS